MDTTSGTMFAQTLEGTWAYNGTGSIKILLQNRKITAYASITDYGFVIPYNGHHPPYLRNGTVGVSRVVSNGHSEDFDPPVQYIARSKVTEVRFSVSSYDVGLKAVNVINYFE